MPSYEAILVAGYFVPTALRSIGKTAHLVVFTSTAGIYKSPLYIEVQPQQQVFPSSILLDTIRKVEEEAQTTIRKNSDLNQIIIKASSMLLMIIFGTTIYYCNKKPNPTPKELENAAPPSP